MEVISRAEAYLNYALKNQDNYPEPISRMDYYLLSVAQEVRAGGADPATITKAVNDYLAANPVQAMTDEQVATSVNKGIADGSINVMSEVEDGSVTESKLNDDVFYNAYVTNGNYGTYPHLKYTIDYTGVTVSSPYTYKVTCKVTPLKDFTMDGMCGISANNAMTEKNSIKSFVANTPVELEYTLTHNSKLTFFKFYGGLNNTLDMVVEDLKMYVNDVEVSLTTPTVTAGKVEYYNLKGKLSNKQYVDDTVKELENKIDFDVIKDYSQSLSHPVSKNQLKNLELAYSLDFTKTDSNFNYTTSQIADGILTLESGKLICDKRYPSLDVFKEVVKFKIADLTTIFGHYNYTRKAFVVDCTDNKLKLCTTDLSAIQSTDSEVEIPFTLTTDTTYTLTTIKNATSVSATLYCESTGQSVTISGTTNYMTGYGQFGIKSYAGTTYVSSYELYLPLIKKNPMWFFGGDSITQGVGVSDISNRWCSRILDNYCSGDGIIWGKGNNVSSELLTRLNVIYDLGYKPKNVVILIGTNDTKSTDTGYSSWVSNIESMISVIEENGGNPILCVPPLKNDTTMNNIIFQMRDYLLSKPYKVIRMDLATSVDGLGAEQDTTLFNSDHVHPNDAGTLKMYQRFLLDIGDGVPVEDNNDHTHDYSEITNTPTIPTKTSDLTNDSGYITKTVENLTNYYLKTELYTQNEINDLIGNINKLDSKIVDVLPTESISTSTVYLIKVGDTTNYTQHMYIDSAWAELGTTQIDLTDYYNKTQADSKFATIETVETHTSDTDAHVSVSEKTLISKIPSDGNVCNTNVADVSETDIDYTLPGAIVPASNGAYCTIKCVVKNGIANVVFSWLLSSTEAVTSWTTIASTLPKPMIQQRGFLLPEKAIDSRIQYSIKTSGELEVYIAEAITTSGWFKGSITYPVAES